jgi:hypothetical protein
MLVILVIVVISLILASRQKTIGRFLRGQLVDPNLDQYNRSTLFTGDPTGVSPWTRAPVITRLAVRYGCMTLLFLYFYAAITHPTLTVAVCATFAAAVTVWWGREGWRYFTTRDLRKMKTALFDGLKQTVGWSDVEKAADVILAAKDYHKTGVTVLPPSDFQRLDPVIENTSIIASRTLGGEWEADFDLVGQPSVRLQHAPPPPDRVTWDDLQYILAAATETQPVIGLGSRSRPLTINIASETPHAMFAGPQGGGKSVALKLLNAQALHAGCQVIVIDLKNSDAHRWMRDIPGVTLCTKVEAAHETLIALKAEQDRRTQIDDKTGLTRIVVTVEELNYTTDMLTAHWNKPRQPSPGVQALQQGLYIGRELKETMYLATQYGDQYAFGGSRGAAARESVGARTVLGTYSEQQWELLFGRTVTYVPSTTHQGRGQLVIAGAPKAVQIGYLTDQQAIDWATSGKPASTPPPTTQPFIGIA